MNKKKTKKPKDKHSMDEIIAMQYSIDIEQKRIKLLQKIWR